MTQISVKRWQLTQLWGCLTLLAAILPASSPLCDVNQRDCLAEVEAINSLHAILDDDQNGKVDYIESADFIKTEMQPELISSQQTNFHGDDSQVTREELWSSWQHSSAANWTTEELISWLETVVELPEVSDRVRAGQMNGKHLPLLAVNSENILQAQLGVRGVRLRQKLQLRAQDVILFGGVRQDSAAKDIVMATALVLLLATLGFSYKKHLHSGAELRTLRGYLLEMQLAAEQLTAELTTHEPTETSMEIEGTELQEWLQLTYELESRVFVSSKIKAERRLVAARDAVEKLSRRRNNPLNMFRTDGDDSIQEVERMMLEAKSSLEDVHTELRERTFRWKRVEDLTGFVVTTNPGISKLRECLPAPGEETVTEPRPTSSFSDLSTLLQDPQLRRKSKKGMRHSLSLQGSFDSSTRSSADEEPSGLKNRWQKALTKLKRRNVVGGDPVSQPAVGIVQAKQPASSSGQAARPTFHLSQPSP